MTELFLAGINIPCVAECDILHDLGEGDVTNLDNQMNMVGHQAEGMDTMPESFYAFLKK